MPANKNDGISRVERAAMARKLRDKGWLHREIARELEISLSYTSALLQDPDGSKEKKRKERYLGTCKQCGGRTTYTSRAKPVRYCKECFDKNRRDTRLWTPERIIQDIRRWNDLYGEPPTATQWLLGVRGDGTRNSRPWPHVACVQREFGSWSNGLEAAGFKRREGYERTPEWRAKVTKWPKERIIQALREWAEVHGRTPTSYDFRSGSEVSPSYSSVVKHCGSWAEAIREAGLTPPLRRFYRSRNGTLPPVPSFAERGAGTPLLKVVKDLELPLTRKGRSLLEVVRELPERR